jgi:cell division protein FtsW
VAAGPGNQAPDEALRPLHGTLLSLVFGLVILGLVFVFSASFTTASRPLADGTPGDSYHFLRLQAVHAIIGFVLIVGISLLHPVTIGRAGGLLFLLTFVLTALTLTGLSFVRCSHGSCRWLQFGPLRLQPSEFAKLALILYVAANLARGPLNARNFGKVGLRIAMASLLLGVVIFMQKDQGMATLIVIITLALCYLGHLRGWWLGLLTATTFGAGLIGLLLEEYRWKRILAFFDPVRFRSTWGWQILVMKTTIARGGLDGVGLAQCPEKLHYLPEPYTDSIFCVLASEAGFIGAFVLLALIGALIFYIMEIASESRSRVGYFMAAGIGVMLSLQFFINIGVAVHLLPVTGLTLPFISYGGSSLVACMAGIGVVMAVHRHGEPKQRQR